MKIHRLYPLTLVIALSCHSAAPKAPTNNPVKMVVPDTTQAAPETVSQNDTPFVPKTHLKDTTYITGSFILFLQPDQARYDEMEKHYEDEMGDADSDFGVGISNTLDSLSKTERYKDIKGLVSNKRYIIIEDCLNGPVTIDRDTVEYGFIIAAKGKRVEESYNAVHSGDYLEEVDSYFYPERLP